MTVSRYQERDQAAPDGRAALSWLQRQLAWERVLDRLRASVGADSPSAPAHPASPPASLQPVQDRPAA